MDAVVLCAGKGKRMLDSLDGSQKCMIQINGKPLVEHILEHLEQVNISRVYFVVGYRGNDIKKHFSGKKTRAKVEFICDDGFEVDSTSRSLLCVEPFIRDDFIYSQGEIFYDVNLISRLKTVDLDKHERFAIMTLSKKIKIAPTHPRVSVSDDNVSKICLYPNGDTQDYPLCYMGVSKLKVGIFDYLRNNLRVSDALNSALVSGENLGFLIYSQYWKHFATREDLLHKK